MLKVRYFKVKIPNGIIGFSKSAASLATIDNSPLRVIQSSKSEVVFNYACSRLVAIRRISGDGSETIESIQTVDIHNLRLFEGKDNQYLSIIDPPRSARLLTEMLDRIIGNDQFFIEPMEFSPELIMAHATKFDSARLVSAKVRDFEVYEGAVGRLEISSQNGLIQTIAPFLENKFYRVDALTYEVSQKYTQGLIYYYRNGTLKVSDPLVDLAFPTFESCFD